MFVSPQIRSHCSDAPRSYLGWYMDTLNLCAGRRPSVWLQPAPAPLPGSKSWIRLHLHALKTCCIFLKNHILLKWVYWARQNRDIHPDRQPKLLLPLWPLQPDFTCGCPHWTLPRLWNLSSLTMIHIIPSTPRLWSVKDANLPLNPLPLILTGSQSPNRPSTRHCPTVPLQQPHESNSSLPNAFRQDSGI